MKRPKLKKASKRMSCSKRFKIQKKVREHLRKLRKDVKKKGTTKRVKKDPGVPSIAPFKEEVLREAELRKLKLEEVKQKKKLEKQQGRERAKKRKKETQSSDSDPKAKKAKKETSLNHPEKSPANKDKFSRKLFCSELNKVINASNVIVEVLDARDPLGCRCPQLEEAVLKSEGNKKLLLVLNKIDLVPKDNVKRWLHYLQREFPAVAFKAATHLQDKTVQEKKKRAAAGPVDQTKGAPSFGNSFLLQVLRDYANAQKSGDMITFGVVGFPNVGKSSVINSLKGIRACNAGAERGLTKCMQEVNVARNIKMIDSPGIIASQANPAVSMALRSLLATEKQKNSLDAVRALLKHCNKQEIMLQYMVPDFRNSLEFLTCFAKKRGFLQKGGVPNTGQAAEMFLSDWTGAKLRYLSKPPENLGLPSYLSDTLVAEMQKGWEMNKLHQGNAETVKSIKVSNVASSIVLSSKGPTSGLIGESEGLETVEAMEKMACQEEAFDEPDLVNEEKHQQEETENGKEPQEATPSSAGRPAKVKFLPMTVNIDLSSVQNNDDAYDFNTDFK